jgi:acyl carrier protein
LTCFACFTYLSPKAIDVAGLYPFVWKRLVTSVAFGDATTNYFQPADIIRDCPMASIEERVIDIVSEQLGVDKDKITKETSFVNDLGADSLDTVELVMELEEEFDISIPDESAEKIQKVGEAVEFIENAKGDDA